MTQEKMQHLEFIQNNINRMNSNSFQIKGIAITIVTALLAIHASNQNIYFVIISILPTFILWLLDSYYLQLERKFRGIYNDVAGVTNNVDVKDYEIPVGKYKTNKFKYINALFSKTICWIYISLISTMLIVGFIHFTCK